MLANLFIENNLSLCSDSLCKNFLMLMTGTNWSWNKSAFILHENLLLINSYTTQFLLSIYVNKRLLFARKTNKQVLILLHILLTVRNFS